MCSQRIRVSEEVGAREREWEREREREREREAGESVKCKRSQTACGVAEVGASHTCVDQS